MMNPSAGPELVVVEVGSGGDEEVRVVARRVGLNRRELGYLPGQNRIDMDIRLLALRCQIKP